MLNNKLFEALRSNTAQAISTLTNDRTFQRGRDYFHERRVLLFEWDKREEGRLIVIVQGSKKYRVSIRLINAVLRVSCDCPAWMMEQCCKHIVCALLAAREDLPQPASAPESMALLEQPKIMTANMKKAKLVTMHLAPREDVQQCVNPAFSLTFQRGLERLGEYDFSATSVERLLCASYKKPWDIEDWLHKLLTSKKGALYGITVHTAQGPLDVIWDADGITGATTELNLVDGVVHARRLARRKDGSAIHSMVRIGRNFFVDIDAKRLFYIDIVTSWPWVEYMLHSPAALLEFDSLQYSLDNSYRSIFDNAVANFVDICRPILLSADIFNTAYAIKYPQGGYHGFAEAFVTKQDGVAVALMPQDPLLVVDGNVDVQAKMITLNLLVTVKGERIDVWQPLLESVRGIDYVLPPWLRTKKRRQLIIQALFSLIQKKKQQEAVDVIKALILALQNTTTGPKRYVELKRHLANFHNIIDVLACEMIAVYGRTFQRVVFDPASAWVILPLLTTFFGVEFFNENYAEHPSFTMPLNVFYARLGPLRQQLNDYGVELRLNSKRLETVALEISVNASGRGGSDWFDLAPHIVADGIVLSNEQRDVLFSNHGGMIESVDCIKILDKQSQEILQILARMFMQPSDGAQVVDKQGIVQIPRLRVLDLLELRQSGANVTLSKEDEHLLTRLTNFTKIEKIQLPEGFVGTLRDYQKDGYRWLAFLYKNRFGACLADDMGLGKTIQAIAFLGGIAESIIVSRSATPRPHLIVVPPTLIFNWEHELATFYPGLRVGVYTSTERNKDFAAYDVVLTSYDRVRIDIDFLKDQQFHVLILDEAQAIKNIEAARTAAVRQLKSLFTIALTGTPLENHLGEYHSIIDVSLPGLLPSYKAFMRCVQEETHAPFIKKTRPFVLRRTKDAVLNNLPPKVESNVLLTMEAKQQKIYATTVAEVKRLIDQAFELKTIGQANIIALTAILRLRQICISPQMLDMTKEAPSPKIEHLASNLDDIVQEGNAALVFSQFTTCLDLVELALKKAGLAYYRIDGKTTMAKRRAIIQSFQGNDAGVAILLLSLKTGGVGLNLTRANYVFHIDPWWNPAVENQASDRSHRIGQKNSVFVTRLIMHHTIEEKMMTLKETKQKLFSEVMEHAENKTKSIITKKDFDLLLG